MVDRSELHLIRSREQIDALFASEKTIPWTLRNIEIIFRWSFPFFSATNRILAKIL
jgi:hypothetical protein